MLFLSRERQKMLNSDNGSGHPVFQIKDVKSKVTAKTASEAFSTADSNDKAAGGAYFADRGKNKKGA